MSTSVDLGLVKGFLQEGVGVLPVFFRTLSLIKTTNPLLSLTLSRRRHLPLTSPFFFVFRTSHSKASLSSPLVVPGSLYINLNLMKIIHRCPI